MPPGERSNPKSQVFDYGASMASENVDFAPESSTESVCLSSFLPTYFFYFVLSPSPSSKISYP